MSTPVIAINRVSHYYGHGSLQKQILFDVCAEIYPGEVVILMGPSGSGKTTLLTLIGALRSTQSGSLNVIGHELNNASDRTLIQVRRHIGYIFQAHNLLNSLTAQQNVQMALELHPTLTGREAQRRSADMWAAVGLGAMMT